MEENKKLSTEDIEDIAKACGCTTRSVRMILDGDRGTRKTSLQQKVMQAAELRLQQKQELNKLITKQNKDLTRFCKTKKVHRVTPQ